MYSRKSGWGEVRGPVTSNRWRAAVNAPIRLAEVLPSHRGLEGTTGIHREEYRCTQPFDGSAEYCINLNGHRKAELNGKFRGRSL